MDYQEVTIQVDVIPQSATYFSKRIGLPEEGLPLSNTCAIVPPLFLKPNTVLDLET